MSWRFLALVATSALTNGALAADKPAFGPAPAWVKPTEQPVTPQNDSAPVRILLSDEQIAFEPGQQTVYAELALKIQSPQGLAAGNLSIPWRPDSDTLTVHKLVIHRGDRVIDVLASGQTFTVLRREQNLESATLDGVLTANIQPEGLQVGDILDYAFSITSSDPILKGHEEQIAAAWNFIPIGRAHMHMQWPSTLPVRFRQTGSLPALKPIKAGRVTSIDLSVDDLQPIVPPRGAPKRYAVSRMVEATDYASWADLGALMAPLYGKASVVPVQGPLHAEVERIESASADPKSRAEAALALVQDRTRYVALAMGAGGYVPADAELTWSRRYGDCKAKTALLLGLLHAMGIKADPVAVSTSLGDGLNERLPMVALFNHVLVRATIAGRTYWLDGTRQGDTSLDRLTVPNFGWGLPLLASGATLVPMVPPPLAAPTLDTAIRIDAHAGINAPAPTTVETILRGDDAIGTNASLAALVGDARDRALRDYWKGLYDFIDVKTAGTRFDPQTGELHLTMTGLARMDWSSGWYETDGSGVGYKADFSRDPSSIANAPYAVDYPTFTRVVETIVLPPHFPDPMKGLDTEVHQTVAGVEYRRHASFTGDTFAIETTERSIEPEFPASEAKAAQVTLRALAGKTVFLRKPSGYVATDAELSDALATTPTTANEFVDRGNTLLDHGMYAEAIKDFNQALGLDPHSAVALADRALAEVWTHDYTHAAKSLDAAQAIDPNNAVVFRGRGLLAQFTDDPKAAVDAFTAALAIEPNNSFALFHRAQNNLELDNDEAALADASAATTLAPTWVDPYYVRASVYLNRHERARALTEMQSVIALDPKQVEAYAAAARIDLAAGRRDAALEALDKAIAIKPSAALYAERSTARPPSDRAARQADIDAALKLDPSSKDALGARAGLQQELGEYGPAIATWSKLVEAGPDDPGPLVARANAYKLSGDIEHALADSGSALKLQPKALDLYLLRANLFRDAGKREDALLEAAAAEAVAPELVYAHVLAANIYAASHENAKAIVAYDRALAIRPEGYIFLNRGMERPKSDVEGRMSDFDAAIAIDPTLAEAWAAKAGLQLDQGDFKSAIATYSTALAKMPDAAELLGGRGVAYARLGDAANAKKDFSAARGMVDTPAELNTLCWQKATAGVALETALAECNAALVTAPDVPNILDSRGLVLLRLGRVDDAISDYSRAISKSPQGASSLFGRSIAWARKGDSSKSATDAAAARQADPDIDADFKSYGLKS